MSPRSCGACRFWTGEEVDGLRQCDWPGPIPFWAHLDDGGDHIDWTRGVDGRACPTFDLAAPGEGMTP